MGVNRISTRATEANTYEVWDALFQSTEGTKLFLCMRMFARPDDQTVLALSKSTWIYGWFEGEDMACWHTAYSAEARDWIQQLLGKAKFT